MTDRSTQTTVSFRHPFMLSPFDCPQPAGSYRLVIEEEEIPGLSFLAYQRTATMLHTPAISSTIAGSRQVFLIDPAELATALELDGRQETLKMSNHRFSVGQSVRLKSIMDLAPGTAQIYQITAILPAREETPQYRIRNEGARQERVVMEFSIEDID